MLIIEGLPEDRIALLVKMHHSTVDGVTGANIIGDLFDLEPEVPEQPRIAPLPPSPAPNSLWLLEQALRARLFEPWQLARLVPATAVRIGEAAWRSLVRHEAGPSPTLPFTAPRTSFNAAVSDQRTVAFTDVTLSEVKAVKDALGVTVNDIVTAIVGAALRQYLADRRELPAHTLIAAEPVSVHGKSAAADGTTQVSVMFTSLGTDVEDPVERLHKVAEANRTAKEVHALVGADTILEWAQHFWPNAVGLGARLYSRLHLADHHPVVHNLILSNVPGPPMPLYLAGSRLVGIYPLGPVMDGAGLNVTALSQEDRIGFGIVACAQLVPDVWQIAEAIPQALTELAKATT
jgi:diacylglycerol O-acyltransferase / wax synthase